MLAEEYDLNVLSLLNDSGLQAEVFQMPTLNKHKQRCKQVGSIAGQANLNSNYVL
jgi:hypothetical protein